MSEPSGTQRKIGFSSSKILSNDKGFQRTLVPNIRIFASGLGAVVISAFLITSTINRETLTPEEVDREVVAKQELRADFSFQTEDVKATREAKNQARTKVPPHYRVDTEKVQNQIQILKQRLAQLQEIRTHILNAYLQNKQNIEPVEWSEVYSFVQKEFAKAYPSIQWDKDIEADKLLVWMLADVDEEIVNRLNPSSDKLLPFPANQTSTSIVLDTQPSLFQMMGKIAEDSLNYVLNEGIISGKEQQASGLKIIIVRGAVSSDEKTTEEIDLQSIPDVKRAIEDKLKPRLQEEARKLTKQNLKSLDWVKIYEAILYTVSDLVTETLQYDPVMTEIARERTAESITPIMKEIAAGEIIQERGKRWTLESRSDAKTYLKLLEQSQGKTPRWFFSLTAHLILALLVYVGLYRAITLWEHKGEPSNETIWYLALLLIIGILVLGRGMQYFDNTGFSVPVTIVGLLFAILVQMRLSAFLSFVTCILLSVLFRYDWRLLIFDMAMTIGAIFSIYRVRKRRDITSASLNGIFVGVLALLAITLTTDTLVSETTVRRLFLLGINGSLCILLVPGILPFLERLFGIVTDFQLLEYSDLNNVILKKLAVQAPATYSHSLILGQLAETAADAIGANGLLARVCAYYHDIGKMNRSEYFYENQNGKNIHDSLSPRNSVRVILSHVTEGIKLAQEYRLPKPIIEAIAQHHGTFRVGYFYQLALEQQKFGDVDERDYRYPGPKPQKPEYAIIMICDSAESAVRSLKNPNPERIRQMVDRLVTERANDGQFDECDLTLRQLNIIIDEVSRALVSLLHLRPSYVDETDENKNGNVTPLPQKNGKDVSEVRVDNPKISGK